MYLKSDAHDVVANVERTRNIEVGQRTFTDSAILVSWVIPLCIFKVTNIDELIGRSF